MRVRAEGTQSGKSTHERLLCQLFSPGPITQSIVYETENRLPVAMKHKAEGIRVASKCGVQCGISSLVVPAASGLHELNFRQTRLLTGLLDQSPRRAVESRRP